MLQPLQRRVVEEDGAWWVDGLWDGEWRYICRHDEAEEAYRCGGVRHA